MAQFNHFELSLLNPSFDSPLVDALTELEILRHLRLETDVHPILFAQLKAVFHMLESLGSARIEGNHTTFAGSVDAGLSTLLRLLTRYFPFPSAPPRISPSLPATAKTSRKL